MCIDFCGFQRSWFANVCCMICCCVCFLLCLLSSLVVALFGLGSKSEPRATVVVDVSSVNISWCLASAHRLQLESLIVSVISIVGASFYSPHKPPS